MDAEAQGRLRLLVADEEGPIAAARARMDGHGDAPSPEVGSLLAWVATTAVARHVVEIGSAGGVSGLWLLRGMEERGVLTSIEPDPHAHALAAAAYQSAAATERVRGILGEPATVLPRLSDNAYEVVVLQTDPHAYPDLLDHALRLLKPGGILVARGTDGAPSAAHAADANLGIATFLERITEIEDLAIAALPLDDGVLLASRR